MEAQRYIYIMIEIHI